MRHILVLGDQLNKQVEPLCEVEAAETKILIIEALDFGHQMPHHKQKLIHCFSSMRHFAAELEEEGFEVHYKKATESFEAGVAEYLQDYEGAKLELMTPNDTDFEPMLRKAVEDNGGNLEIISNGLWLSDEATFADWADGRKELRMEYFYRDLRKRYDYLMDGDEPRGGRWNFDKDNRKPASDEQDFPELPSFAPDDITREVIDFVTEEFAENFGDAEPFGWAVTREDALTALKDFCENRLRYFGPYEDAMLQDEQHLYHSLLSPLINVGLLHPQEVIETALDYAEDGRRKIPLNSIEGFVRQILGWREFMFRVYKYCGLEMRAMNHLKQNRSLPKLYWNGETKMNCLKTCLSQLKKTAHNHHIQRLMVLNNFALVAGINPQELTDWFTAVYIDALEWVMVPNVVGMGQYADGGKMTSKPYAASANYINKMSDYCKNCHYSHSKKTGENACPFNSLYWDFLERHKSEFTDNARMNMVMSALERLKEKDEILERAKEVKKLLEKGEL